MRHAAGRKRSGAAFLVIVVTLALIAAIMGTTAWQITTSRRLLDQRQHQLQAAWLARAGMEIACARLLSDPSSYKGEILELIPQSQVRIEVASVPNSPNTFHVVSAARYPVDTVHPAARSITAEVRRAADKSKVRIELKVQASKGPQ